MVSRACGAVSCEPLADFGNSVIARLEHHSGRPPYDAASRRGHGLPALLRRGDRSRGALLDDRPLAPESMEGSIPVEPARAGIVVLEALGDGERLVGEPQRLVRFPEEPETPTPIAS